MKPTSEQQQITNWFNQTYLTKGERYLRDVEAYRFFPSVLNLNEGDSLLDVACGLGRLLQAGQEKGCKITGVDISSVAVEKTKQLFPDSDIRVANAEDLPFDSGSFTAITCIGSLERMLDLSSVLNELHRVGTQQARYCFLVRNSETLIWKWFKQRLGMRNEAGHQGAKSFAEWNSIFAEHGFKVEKVLHDQYPLQRLKRILTLGLAKVDSAQVIESSIPIERTGKFIYVLTKATSC